jgi:hypothetical protein
MMVRSSQQERLTVMVKPNLPSVDRWGRTASGQRDYANKRAEIWGSMRTWLRDGAIDKDPELIADLTGVEYGYVLRDGRDAIQLERKEDMKRRGLLSPDNGDALALTFAYPVLAPSTARSRRPGRFFRSEYDVYASARMCGLEVGDRSAKKRVPLSLLLVAEIVLRRTAKRMQLAFRQ